MEGWFAQVIVPELIESKNEAKNNGFVWQKRGFNGKREGAVM